MKKYIYILLAALMMSSCDVGVENPNAMTPNSFWKKESDAQYGLDAVYNYFNKPDMFSRWMWFRLDITSDEGFSQSPWAELKEWTQFTYNIYNFWEGNRGTYGACYKAIYRANQVITYVPNIEFKNQDEKNRILAQAHFLRGFYYYYLALLWGSENKSLAIMLEPSTTSMLPAGHTGLEVYEQAVADFTEAQKYLPNEWTGDDKGRATKGAALAFRAKTYMQLHRYEEAKADLKWLVEGDGKAYYDLVPNYHDNFTSFNENNIESVFEIQFSDIHKAPAGDDDFAVEPNLGLNRGQFFAPPGIGYSDGEIRPWVVAEFKKEKDVNGGNDIRLKYTAFYEGMEKDFTNNEAIYTLISNDQTWAQPNWKGRVFFRKYGADYTPGNDDFHNPTNVRLIRFADVLLMYAECIAETGGSISTAAGLVDRVRTRANMPSLTKNHASATTDKGAFLKRLQMERALELATEGHRWEDIIRWGLLDTQAGIDELASRDADFKYWDAGQNKWVQRFEIGKHNVLPIASSEVNNNPNIVQNPNY